MKLLSSVDFCLPRSDFATKLIDYLKVFGESDMDRLLFRKSDQGFLPQVSLRQVNYDTTEVEFITNENSSHITLTNLTNEQRKNPQAYKPISLATYIQRATPWKPTLLDHIGFNLPWFDGTHPEIISLRRILSRTCAYYRFPTGEDWDFILPSSSSEILDNNIDLAVERRPKIEIVSFEKASTPLIQIDFQIDTSFAALKETFPEGIIEHELHKVWVYLRNPYQIDICLVIEASNPDDWSAFFSGHRLLEGSAQFQ